VRLYVAIVLSSFVLNELWEMAQMPAYAETAGRSLSRTIGPCSRAAVGDVGITLGIHTVIALAVCDLGWTLRRRWGASAAAAALGLACAILVECAALAAGRWSYTEQMPVVPALDAGLWPLLQMTLLPPFTFLVPRKWVGRILLKGFAS
jgi:fatty acid desaturase